METFSALLAFNAGNSPVTGEFPAQRPVMRSFDVLFDLRLNQQLSKQRKRRWFEMQSRLLWRHCNAVIKHEAQCYSKDSHDFFEVSFDYCHYDDVTMGGMASQITSLTIVYSTVYSGADERKHQSSASLAFVRGFHRGPVNSPHKWPVTQKLFPFDDVIMINFEYASIGKTILHQMVDAK